MLRQKDNEGPQELQDLQRAVRDVAGARAERCGHWRDVGAHDVSEQRVGDRSTGTSVLGEGGGGQDWEDHWVGDPPASVHTAPCWHMDSLHPCAHPYLHPHSGQAGLHPPPSSSPPPAPDVNCSVPQVGNTGPVGGGHPHIWAAHQGTVSPHNTKLSESKSEEATQFSVIFKILTTSIKRVPLWC